MKLTGTANAPRRLLRVGDVHGVHAHALQVLFYEGVNAQCSNATMHHFAASKDFQLFFQKPTVKHVSFCITNSQILFQQTHAQAERVVGVREWLQHVRQRKLAASLACLRVVPTANIWGSGETCAQITKTMDRHVPKTNM